MKDTNQTDETMNCGLSVAERDLLQAGLIGLADTMPPREVWQRIERQARAEGLFRPRIAESTKWFAGAGIAAAVVIAVLNVPLGTTVVDNGGGFDATPAPSVATSNTTPPNLNALMVQSAELERDLRALPVQPSVVQASTAASIEQIEYRIAEIDYYLNHPQVRMNPAQAEMYWRERVRLMNSLLSLRRAQAQRMAF
ncbi:MAG: hypothetical protein OEV41_06785 [Gammaproteobacteria bacterium]|nr:hypothetical protein [Gammaproteobacteria bacterium]MDH5344561.1 hypothetical protein [Gammaproteobacteria bacterium]